MVLLPPPGDTQVSYLPISFFSFHSWGHCQSHLCSPGQSLVKTIASCEETCFYLKSGCGHLRDHWKTYCARVFISCSLLSDLLRTPLFHELPSAEAEVFAFWLLVRDVSSFSGCHFFSLFGTIGDGFRAVLVCWERFQVFLAVLQCFPHRRAFNGSTYPQSFKDAQCNFLCILTPSWLCCPAPCLKPRWIDFAMVPSLPGEESFGSVWKHSFPWPLLSLGFIFCWYPLKEYIPCILNPCMHCAGNITSFAPDLVPGVYSSTPVSGDLTTLATE